MTPDDENEFSLAAVIASVWRHRLVVGITGFVCATIAGVMVFTTKPTFRAESVVVSARESGLNRAGMLGSELGGLASLAGVDLSQNNGPNQQAAAVLESRYLAEDFVKRNDLVRVLLPDSGKPPTLWRAAKRFKEELLVIRKDQRRGTTTVSVEWTDPAIAARWANDYVALADELIRNRAIQDATRNIAYLNGQLAKTNDVELRRVMYSLVEEETKTLMLANGGTQYAFEVVDPAVAPELKVGPHRLLMTLVGFTLGLGAAGTVVYIWDSVARQRRKTRGGGTAVRE